MQNQSSDHTGQGTALRVCLKRPHVVRSIANQQKPEWVERSLRIQNHYRYRRAAISSLMIVRESRTVVGQPTRKIGVGMTKDPRMVRGALIVR